MRVVREVPQLAEQVGHPFVPRIRRVRQVDAPALDLRRHRPRPRLLPVLRAHGLDPAHPILERVHHRRAVRLVLHQPLMHAVAPRVSARLRPGPQLHPIHRLGEAPPAALLRQQVPIPARPGPPLRHHVVRGVRALERHVPRVDPARPVQIPVRVQVHHSAVVRHPRRVRRPIAPPRAVEDRTLRRCRALLVHRRERVGAHRPAHIRPPLDRLRARLLHDRAEQRVALLAPDRIVRARDRREHDPLPVQRIALVLAAHQPPHEVVLVPPRHHHQHEVRRLESGLRHAQPPVPQRLALVRAVRLHEVLDRVVDDQHAGASTRQVAADRGREHPAALDGLPHSARAAVGLERDAQPGPLLDGLADPAGPRRRQAAVVARQHDLPVGVPPQHPDRAVPRHQLRLARARRHAHGHHPVLPVLHVAHRVRDPVGQVQQMLGRPVPGVELDGLRQRALRHVHAVQDPVPAADLRDPADQHARLLVGGGLSRQPAKLRDLRPEVLARLLECAPVPLSRRRARHRRSPLARARRLSRWCARRPTPH